MPPRIAPSELTPPHPEVRSYGKQTVFADGVSALSVVVYPVGIFSLPLGYVFAAPSIHLAHHRPGAALASFGLRAVIPAATFFAVGAASDPSLFASCSEGPCGLGGLIYGGTAALAAAVGVSVFDALVLAHETVGVSGKPLPHRSWQPGLRYDPRTSAGQIGVRTEF